MVKQILASIQNQTHANYLQWIKTQLKESVRLIPVLDVDYFQAGDKYTQVITAVGESLLKRVSGIWHRNSILKSSGRSDRATIVNVSKNQNMSRSITGRGILKLKNRKESLTVSRQYLHLIQTNVIRLSFPLKTHLQNPGR